MIGQSDFDDDDIEEIRVVEYNGDKVSVEFSTATKITDATTPVLEILDDMGDEINVGVYGGRFVRPVRQQVSGTDGITVRSIALVPFCEYSLIAALARGIELRVKRKDGSYPVDCPLPVIKSVLAQPDRCPKIHIDRLALTPIIRNGRLYSKPGHNIELRTWICSPELSLPPVNRKAAEAALSRIRVLLDEFRFEDELSESAAIALLLTAATRASLNTAPGFAISKPHYGAGASFLTNIAAILQTGDRAASLSAETPEELTKAVNAAQFAALPCLALDNIPRGTELQNIELAKVLSEPYRLPRILGVSQVSRVSNFQLVIVNGNSIRITRDLARRFIRVGLSVIPKAYRFSRPDLLSEVQRDRAAILLDLYTIVLAYQQSGDSVPVKEFHSFDDWVRMVAAPLMWLDMPSPLDTQKIIADEDTEALEVGELFRLWHDVFGERPVSVSIIMGTNNGGVDKGKLMALHKFVESRCGHANTNTVFGNLLRDYKDMVADNDLKLERVSHSNVARWRVVDTTIADWLKI